MPLEKNGRPWVLAEFPDEIEEDDAIFKIRFTGEIFLSYEDYLEQLDLYMRRDWTCAFSKRKNLTFEEALESEHTIETLAAMFPQALIREAVLLIHRSGLSLPDLVTKLELYFQSNETFGEWPEQLQRKIASSFIMLSCVALPVDGQQTMVRPEMLQQYGLDQQSPRTVGLPSHPKMGLLGSASRKQPVALPLGSNHLLAAAGKCEALHLTEGIVATDTGPPSLSKDPDPFPDVTGDVIFVWKHLCQHGTVYTLPCATFQEFYESLQMSTSVANIALLSKAYSSLLSVVFLDIPRDVIIKSNRMPHFFRKVTGQNLEEKMGVYLVAMEKMAATNTKEYCEISDDILGDCCRETGDDWDLANLNVKAKVSLFKFLCDQSLKANTLSTMKQPPKVKAAPEEDCSPPKGKRRRVNSKTSPIHKGETPVIKQEVDPDSASPDPVDNLGVDRCQNEYWYIPSMPHHLFVKSRVTNTWGYYKYSTQVDQLLRYLDQKHPTELTLRENISKHAKAMKTAMDRHEKAQQWVVEHSVRRTRSQSEQ